MSLVKLFNFLFFLLIFTLMATGKEDKNTKKIKQNNVDVHTIIRTRRSIRRFKQEPIPFEILKQIVYDASLAPSAGNKQPWEFIIVTQKEKRKIIFENIFWLKSAGNPQEDEQPQAYIIVLGNPEISREYIYDCSAAIQNILLSAWGYGIGSCWIGSINREKIYNSFGIPKKLQIVAIVALGYPKETPEVVHSSTIAVVPYKRNNTLVVPKRTIEQILHVEKY
ncbi:MAG: nitroreductase family protein [Endomicrobia bacterium]|nr:nitroreductase family protein [Endomicrobiia bacterium]